jgi:hypothetical protein
LDDPSKRLRGELLYRESANRVAERCVIRGLLRRNMDDEDRFGIAITRSSHRSMSRPGRRGLQLDDSPPDPLPNGLAFEVAARKHQVGAPGRSKLGIVTMLPDQHVGGSPDVEVGDHRYCG